MGVFLRPATTSWTPLQPSGKLPRAPGDMRTGLVRYDVGVRGDHQAVLDGARPPRRDLPGVPVGLAAPFALDRFLTSLLERLHAALARSLRISDDLPERSSFVSVFTHRNAMLLAGASPRAETCPKRIA